MGTQVPSRGASRQGNVRYLVNIVEPDEVVIDRAVAGMVGGLRLYPTEIREAVRILCIERGMTGMDAARRIGVCDRTVSRHLHALRSES